MREGAPARLARPLSRLLRRAGAGGAWHGGPATGTALGVMVEVRSEAELREALRALHEDKAGATLLLPARLFGLAAEEAGPGAQLALWGRPGGASLAWLDLLAGGGLSWQPGRPGEERGGPPPNLPTLPLPSPTPAPGSALQVPARELAGELAHWRALGYRPLAVRDLPGLRRAGPGDAWRYLYGRAVEGPYERRSGSRRVGERPEHFFKVAPLAYAPAPLPLPQKTPTAELHLDSARVVALARNPLATYRAYQRNLRGVARLLREDPALREAQAVFAVTLFHPVLAREGFEVLELPPGRARLYSLGFRLLRGAYGTFRTPSEGRARLAWLPREAFLQRFGDG